jgi:hypothetical protein
VTIAEFAKQQNVTRQAVEKAIKRGRLVGSITHDAEGRVVIAPELGAAEWLSAERLPTNPGALAAHSLKHLSAPAAKAVARRLEGIVSANVADRLRYERALVAPVVDGAAEALRVSGRKVTEAELVAALHLEHDDEDAGAELLVAIEDLANEGGPELATRARQLGREAVRTFNERNGKGHDR